MIKSRIFIILFSISYFSIQAQEDEVDFKSFEDGTQRDKIILSISLLSQFDINSPSLQLGLDVKLSEGVGIHQELGYVNNWLNPFYAYVDEKYSARFRLKNGVKYIFEPRFYPFLEGKKFTRNMFFAPSVDIRYVNITRNEWVARYNYSYTQKMDYNINKFAIGGLMKFGFTIAQDKKMPLDIVLGMGARKSFKTTTLPDDAQVLPNSLNLLSGTVIHQGQKIHPAFYLGLLLHLPIKK